MQYGHGECSESLSRCVSLWLRVTHIDHALVSEGRSLEPTNVLVLTCRHNTEGTDRAVVNGIDELAVASDFSNRTARVPQKYMTKSEQKGQ